MKWIQILVDSWPLVLAILVAVLNLLNALTPHFSQLSGLSGWLAAFLERASVLTSRGADMPFKFPLTSRPPSIKYIAMHKPPTAGLALILFLVVLQTGCASIASRAEQVHYGAKAASAIAEPLFRARCQELAHQCVEQKDVICEAYQLCAQQRDAVNQGIISVHAAANAAVVLSTIDEKATAKERIEIAFQALKQTYDLLAKLGMVPKRGGK